MVEIFSQTKPERLSLYYTHLPNFIPKFEREKNVGHFWVLIETMMTINVTLEVLRAGKDISVQLSTSAKKTHIEDRCYKLPAVAAYTSKIMDK